MRRITFVQSSQSAHYCLSCNDAYLGEFQGHQFLFPVRHLPLFTAMGKWGVAEPGHAMGATMWVRSVISPSIAHSTTSPGLRKSSAAFCFPMAVPPGVPVANISPGSKGM